MAVLDLLDFENLSSSIGGFDHGMLRLKIEFLLLAQTLCDAVEEKDSEVFHRIRLILEFGLRGLDSVGHCGEKVGNEEDLALEMALSDLHGVILDQADVFDVLCWNIHRQVNIFPEATELTIIASGDVPESSDSSRGEFEDLVKVQRTVQMTHLSALNKYIESGDLESAISNIRYIHLDFGVDEPEYRMVLKYLIKEIWIQKGGYEEAQNSFQNKMLLMYTESLSANCTQFLHIIEAIQDELLTDEIEKNQHVVLDNVPIPFPLQNYLTALKLGCTTGLDNQKFQTMIAHSCMGDMYQYARLSGAHILECVMNCALSAVKREQLQEACDVLSLFPLLQPLVAAMGWDLLSGKTSMRKKLMLTLWMSKSQAVRMEESSFYGKQSDEMSCVDYLCDLLCFHLDVASFAACVNSGHAWNSKDSILFSKGKKQQVTYEKAFFHTDPFVENFVLERLATQTPLR
ncbi:putative Zinc finger protein, partial [Zostera marina]